MKWENIRDPRNGIADCFAILFVEGLLFLLAAAYLQVQCSMLSPLLLSAALLLLLVTVCERCCCNRVRALLL